MIKSGKTSSASRRRGVGVTVHGGQCYQMHPARYCITASAPVVGVHASDLCVSSAMWILAHMCNGALPPVQKSKNFNVQWCITNNMMCIKIQPLHCTPPTLSLTILNCLLMIMRGLLGPSLFKRANLPLMHLGWPFQCIRVTVDLLVSCYDKSAHLMLAVEFQSSAVVNRQKLLMLLKGGMDISKVKGQ